jgi:streptogramin lyase
VIRNRTLSLACSAALMLAALSFAPNLLSQSRRGTTALSGRVTTPDGKPLEGIGVSARKDGETFTTTVYTDQTGMYSFRGAEPGHYKIWAQAEGFEAAVKEVDFSRKSEPCELTLAKLEDFEKQLSGIEMMASLPGDSPSDRRMKAIFTNNCTSCHPASYTLQNRFDEAGWKIIINLMSTITPLGNVPEGAKPNQIVQAYRDELAAYLARVRGPDSLPLNLVSLPRPAGDAIRVVITEYDLTRPGKPAGWVMPHNGSDWSEGTPSRYEGRAAHDVAVDRNGIVWFSDDGTPGRTIGKLDPKTGQVTDYILMSPSGALDGTHGLTIDHDGNLWGSNTAEGSPTEFSPETQKFQTFPRPSALPFAGTFVVEDSKGNAWAADAEGALKVDPRTGTYTSYTTVTHGKGSTYGLDIDREDNVWIAQPGADEIAVIAGDTGKITQVELDPLDRTGIEITPKDRDLSSTGELGPNNATPLEKGPRRLAADKDGDFVWVAEYFADRLARIDIHSRKVTEYPLPHRYSQPYAVAVDKNHMVWLSLINTDRIAKFNPSTGKFTEYELPTRGTEIRHIYADDRTDPPTIWLPYDRTNKIARLQFTKAGETQ